MARASFNVEAGDLNSGLQVCTASAPFLLSPSPQYTDSSPMCLRTHLPLADEERSQQHALLLEPTSLEMGPRTLLNTFPGNSHTNRLETVSF